MIWTFFRVINLHPVQIRITCQAIRKSLKRTSPSGESHRAIVHLHYILCHSAYSYLSLFLMSKIAHPRGKVKRFFEIRLGYYFFPTGSKEELPKPQAKETVKGTFAAYPRCAPVFHDSPLTASFCLRYMKASESSERYALSDSPILTS